VDQPIDNLNCAGTTAVMLLDDTLRDLVAP
jgi:hypothetical protein